MLKDATDQARFARSCGPQRDMVVIADAAIDESSGRLRKPMKANDHAVMERCWG